MSRIGKLYGKLVFKLLIKLFPKGLHFLFLCGSTFSLMFIIIYLFK